MSARQIYAVRDRVAQDLAGLYPLVVFRTDAQAVRYFADSIFTKERSALSAHPDDYELVCCGLVGDDGRIQALPEPNIVITGSALVASMQDHQATQEIK